MRNKEIFGNDTIAENNLMGSAKTKKGWNHASNVKEGRKYIKNILKIQ